jgi:hypothetical protein
MFDMSDMDPVTLTLTIAFSIIGLGYFSYGRKNDIYFMLCGIGLVVYPYFISQTGAQLLTGVVLVVLPFILTRLFPF